MMSKHEDDPPTKPGRPPPLPARRHSPSPFSEPNPDAGGAFPDSEAPTTPKGLEFQVALLAKYFGEMAPEDRQRILWEAEHYADRNRK